MTDKVIEYKSAPKLVGFVLDVLDTSDKQGVVCSWTGDVYNGYSDYYNSVFTWKFDWKKLKNQGVDRLSGHLILKPSGGDYFSDKKVEIDWKQGKETTIIDLATVHCDGPYDAMFEYSLTPHYSQIEKKVSYDEMFSASDQNDTVLVIEGKKLHVSKAFLSYHSEFFRDLFSANFNEGQLTEIPIKEVSYQDFGLLMSTIYPKLVYPNDRTAEKLLELADRFLMPSVTHLVELRLLEHSNISNEELMWMADAYGMKDLLEKCIKAMNTVEKAKKLKNSEEFEKLSGATKHKLFDRLVDIS